MAAYGGLICLEDDKEKSVKIRQWKSILSDS